MGGATGSEFDEADLRQVGSDRIWIEPKFACPTQIHLAQGGIHLDPIREKLLEIPKRVPDLHQASLRRWRP